jgi:hypothetical protein
MSFPIDDIKLALQSFCVTATGLSGDKVIFAYQGGTEPSGSYVSIIPFLMMRKGNLIDEKYREENGDITVIKRRTSVAQIDCYGPNAVVNIAKIVDALDTPTIQAIFDPYCLNAQFSSNTRNLSGVKNIRYEERHNIDIDVMSAYTETLTADSVGWFNTINANTTTLNPQLGEIIITRGA